jgi:hypothetical protein
LHPHLPQKLYVGKIDMTNEKAFEVVKNALKELGFEGDEE